VGLTPELLGLYLGPARVESVVAGYGRPQYFANISRSVRVAGIEPEWILSSSAGIAGTVRPRPFLRYSFITRGWIRYCRKSFATVTFLAPLAMKPPRTMPNAGIGLPLLPRGTP
jgi:hypothetical protein